MNRKSVIPVSALISFGTIALADIQHNDKLPGTREILGFVIVYTMISAGADFGVPIAGPFAILVMLTILLTRGPEALKFLTGKVAAPKPKGKRPQSAPVEPKFKPQRV
jgi:hypothetical protein